MSVRPNCVTLVNVMSACYGLRSLQLGKAVHGYSLRNVDEFSILLGNAILDLYVKMWWVKFGCRVSVFEYAWQICCLE